MSNVSVTQVRDFVRIKLPHSGGYTMSSSEAWQLMADLAELLGATINGISPSQAKRHTDGVIVENADSA